MTERVPAVGVARPERDWPGRVYWEVAVRGYRRYATYRGATAAGIFTNTIFGFMRVAVLLALFRVQPHAGGYSVAGAITYVWIAQGLLMPVYLWGWYDIAVRVRSGDIVTDLQRPLDFQGYWLAQDLGRACYHAVFRGLPPGLIGSLVFTLALPAHLITYPLFVLSVFLSVCASFGMRFLVNMGAFWLLDYRGIGGLFAALATFLSGLTVPLALFPGIWRSVAELLPFAALIQTPVDIFLEQYHGTALLRILGLQAFWAASLLLLGRWVLLLARRKVVVQGG